MIAKEKLKKGPLVLYEQMRLKILELIEELDLKPHDPVPSEGELAHLFGVSTRTSKEALLMLAKESVVYRLPRRGTFLSEKLHPKQNEIRKFLAIILPEIDDYIGQVITGANQYAIQLNYELVLRFSKGNLAEEESILRELSDGNLVSGIVLFPGDRKTCSDEVLKLHLAKFPIVIVDRTFREINIPSVYHDHYQGAFEITKYLITKGHTYIGFVSEDIPGVMSREERYHGYLGALIDNNTPPQVNSIYTGIRSKAGIDEDDRSADLGFNHFLLANPEMTAIFCSNDFVAMYVMNLALKQGIKVPDDLSIVGFTDFPIASLLPVPLTTVRKPAAKLGQSAVQLLLDRILFPAKAPPSVKLDTELIERQSVRAVKKQN